MRTSCATTSPPAPPAPPSSSSRTPPPGRSSGSTSGADSLGIAGPAEWEAVVRKHGGTPRLLALDRRRFPHDIAINARYDQALATLPRARHPWSPLTVHSGLTGPAEAGLLRDRLGG